jgi:hypothetical protein
VEQQHHERGDGAEPVERALVAGDLGKLTSHGHSGIRAPGRRPRRL